MFDITDAQCNHEDNTASCMVCFAKKRVINLKMARGRAETCRQEKQCKEHLSNKNIKHVVFHYISLYFTYISLYFTYIFCDSQQHKSDVSPESYRTTSHLVPPSKVILLSKWRQHAGTVYQTTRYPIQNRCCQNIDRHNIRPRDPNCRRCPTSVDPLYFRNRPTSLTPPHPVVYPTCSYKRWYSKPKPAKNALGCLIQAIEGCRRKW